jgi:predicted alpha/beta hydrolase
MRIKSLRVAAYKDEFPLAVTVFASSESRNDADKTVVLINNATGITQNFYSAFAKYNSV